MVEVKVVYVVSVVVFSHESEYCTYVLAAHLSAEQCYAVSFGGI